MSRSGYHDDSDDLWASIRWRGAVAAAIRGRRGQNMLRELIAALDAMPEKRLIKGFLVTPQEASKYDTFAGECSGRVGEVCALGALGLARGIDMTGIDPEDYYAIATAFDIAKALAREIEYENDEREPMKGESYLDDTGRQRWRRIPETPEERWQRMRDWAAKQIWEWQDVGQEDHPRPEAH